MDQQTYQSLEPSKDSVRPQERSGKYNAKFWVDRESPRRAATSRLVAHPPCRKIDAVGEACAELLSFGQKHEEYGAIYDRLLQLRTESLSGGRTRVKYVGHGYYLSMLQGGEFFVPSHVILNVSPSHPLSTDDMLKRYKVAQDAATLAMQVSAISFPGHILVGHCRVIQQIVSEHALGTDYPKLSLTGCIPQVAAQPCETIDGRSRPLYRHIGELVWKPECNAIPHAEAVRAVAMHFGTLLGFATAYNPHLTLQPNVRSPFVPEKRIPGSHSS